MTDVYVETTASATDCVGVQNHALRRHLGNRLETQEKTKAATVESYVPPVCATNL